MVPRLHPETRELIANQTASQILDICNGERTLEKVVDEFAELYPDVDKNLLSQDVYSTLASYTRLGIISWIGENPFKTTLSCLLDENVIASIASEEELKQIVDIVSSFGLETPNIKVNQDYFLYRSPFMSNSELNPVSIRYKLFSFMEDYFLLRKGNKVIGVISVQMPTEEFGTGCNIRTIVSPHDYFQDFLQYALRETRTVAIKPIQKAKIFLELGKPGTDRLMDMLRAIGFTAEGSLKGEIGEGSHLELLSYFYQ